MITFVVISKKSSMKISYKWLKEYLPADEAYAPHINDVQKLAEILTSIGLEVESIEKYESVKGSLSGLITAEVVTCDKHPDADKLKVTTVNTGSEKLQVVCGAPNVAAGQKVVLAPPGTTLYDADGNAFLIKKAKIRGVESFGMICSEAEIGLGDSHEGIMVLGEDTEPGLPASEVFDVYTDHVIEIGLTPNRMDAQSHLGIAKDVCAWLSHHTETKAAVISPLGRPFAPNDNSRPMQVQVKDQNLAPRYAGVTISNITIGPSPDWMQNKLSAIGLKPINNVVDITNFILHTTGQPLHAFDADKVEDGKVIVKTLPSGTPFVTLDEKERKLHAEDIMICDGNDRPMCIAGVFGGADSGVTEATKDIFLESAVFNSQHIRKSHIRHDLRTDAAVRFEKGVDISRTVEVLKYAALLIKEICGGSISSQIVDVFREPEERVVTLSFNYLRKLSGRSFEKKEVQSILESLGFEVRELKEDSLTAKVPESNPDISLPADLVEEVLRISGLDNIPIPRQVRMTPGTDNYSRQSQLEDRISSWLMGNGFSEIFTNSITNETYYNDEDHPVRILNSLSEELTILRKTMLPTALEAIEHNYNRQNKNLLFFEFGKTYGLDDEKYLEQNHLAVYGTGLVREKAWNAPAQPVDLFYIKGIAESIFRLAGLSYSEKDDGGKVSWLHNDKIIAIAGTASKSLMKHFSMKQAVFYLDIDWDLLLKATRKSKVLYEPLSRFPIVNRDLSMVLDKSVAYLDIKKLIESLRIKRLSGFDLFDLYESDKLGADKKSIAMSFSFSDPQRTLTDKETDKMMQQIMKALETQYQAEIRSHA